MSHQESKLMPLVHLPSAIQPWLHGLDSASLVTNIMMRINWPCLLRHVVYTKIAGV